MLRLRSVGVAPRTASFTRNVHDVLNEAFQPTHVYFSPRYFGEMKDFTSEAEFSGKLVQSIQVVY